MTKRETVSLAVKITALFILLNRVGGFVLTTMASMGVRNPVSDEPMWQMNGLLISGAALAVALCVALIRGSDQVAEWAVPEDGEVGGAGEGGARGMEFGDWLTLGINLISLFVMAQALFEMVEQVAMHRGLVSSYGNYPVPDEILKEQFLPRYLSIVVRLVVGLVLFLRPRGVANLWARFQDSRRIPGEEDREI